MNDDDEKTDAHGGAGQEGAGAEDRWKRAPASSRQDQFPVRNTAPAGTPAQRFPAAATLPLGAPIGPEQLGPPPVVKSTSERPPAVETMTQARTVGGQTARLKVPDPEEDPARTRGRRPPATAKPRAEDDDRPPPASGRSGAQRVSPRGAGRDARSAALRSKDGPSWEAEVKFSETELPAAKAPAAATQNASDAGQSAESRWPFAIALGAVAFAIGSLLPLPFRKHIVASQGEAASVQAPVIPIIPRSAAPPSVAPSSAAPAGAATALGTGTATAAAPVEAWTNRPGASSAPAASTATAAPSGAPSTGKRPTGKAGKGGHIGDIF